MKRTLLCLSLFALLTACVPNAVAPTLEVSATQAEIAVSTNEPSALVTPTETSASSETPATLLYLSGTTHIETNPSTWPDVDQFLEFLSQVSALGVPWSVGADVGWLEGEPRAAEVIQASEAWGVVWDVHVHNAGDYAKAAYLIRQLGGHPTGVISGMLIADFASLRHGYLYRGEAWEPTAVWGGVVCAGHRPGCDDLAAGLWRPSESDYFAHDPAGEFIRVGGGTHQLADARSLAADIAAGVYDYPLISFTVMVAPVELEIVNSGDGIEEISAFVAEMTGYDFVRWATIEETAEAWLQAGGVASRIEME